MYDNIVINCVMWTSFVCRLNYTGMLVKGRSRPTRGYCSCHMTIVYVTLILCYQRSFAGTSENVGACVVCVSCTESLTIIARESSCRKVSLIQDMQIDMQSNFKCC